MKEEDRVGLVRQWILAVQVLFLKSGVVSTVRLVDGLVITEVEFLVM